MKKLNFLLILLLFFIGIREVNAFDNTLKIYDYAQILSNKEEADLKKAVDEYIKYYNIDMILVTVKHHQKNTTWDYANAFYTYNNFGIENTKSGIICVVDFTFEKENIEILSKGSAINFYDKNRINNMISKIKNENNYYNKFHSFINYAKEYVKLGVVDTNSSISQNEQFVNSKSTLNIFNWIIVLIVSLLIPSVVIIILLFKSKNKKRNLNNNYYTSKEDVVISMRNDKFITTHTSSIRK